MFKKYIHLESLKSEEVQGLLDAPCYIMPKLDGANASIWWNGEKVCCGSRNNEITNDETALQGFVKYVRENNDLFSRYFAVNPSAIIYGEWLVPHTIKHYQKEAWKNFYAFDVLLQDSFIHPVEAYEVFNKFNIPTIPILGQTTTADKEELEGHLKACKWLLEEGEYQHEGLVLKRHDFVNKWGRTTFGKYVPLSMKYVGKKLKGDRLEAYKDGVEAAIIHDFLTDHLLNKELDKVRIERGFETLDPKLIGQCMGTVWHALITEEIWNILKKFKNPKIDFSHLKRLCDDRVRQKFLELE